jgi:serine protease
VYVRLWSKIGGNWVYTDCTYRGSDVPQSAAETAPAVMISPANGSVLPGSTVTFTWSAGSGVTEYWLYLSRVVPGGKELYYGSQGLNHSKTLTGLPADRGAVYVRLWSRIAGVWQYADFSYQASGRP